MLGAPAAATTPRSISSARCARLHTARPTHPPSHPGDRPPAPTPASAFAGQRTKGCKYWTWNTDPGSDASNESNAGPTCFLKDGISHFGRDDPNVTSGSADGPLPPIPPPGPGPPGPPGPPTPPPPCDPVKRPAAPGRLPLPLKVQPNIVSVPATAHEQAVCVVDIISIM